MTLRQKQSEFLFALARLILWAGDQGYEFTQADGNVDPKRKVRLPNGDVVSGCRDLNHKENGLHYKRLAQDLNLFVNGKFITNGDHPAWQAIGRKWKTLDSLARWGGDFAERDSNHLSFEHEGKL